MTTIYTVEKSMDWEYNNLLLATTDRNKALTLIEEHCKIYDHGSKYGFPIKPEVTKFDDGSIDFRFDDDMIDISLRVWKD